MSCCRQPPLTGTKWDTYVHTAAYRLSDGRLLWSRSYLDQKFFDKHAEDYDSVFYNSNTHPTWNTPPFLYQPLEISGILHDESTYYESNTSAVNSLHTSVQGIRVLDPLTGVPSGDPVLHGDRVEYTDLPSSLFDSLTGGAGIFRLYDRYYLVDGGFRVAAVGLGECEWSCQWSPTGNRGSRATTFIYDNGVTFSTSYFDGDYLGLSTYYDGGVQQFEVEDCLYLAKTGTTFVSVNSDDETILQARDASGAITSETAAGTDDYFIFHSSESLGVVAGTFDADDVIVGTVDSSASFSEWFRYDSSDSGDVLPFAIEQGGGATYMIGVPSGGLTQRTRVAKIDAGAVAWMVQLPTGNSHPKFVVDPSTGDLIAWQRGSTVNQSMLLRIDADDGSVIWSHSSPLLIGGVSQLTVPGAYGVGSQLLQGHDMSIINGTVVLTGRLTARANMGIKPDAVPLSTTVIM